MMPAISNELAPSTDAEFAAAFQCPESLPDDKARADATNAFVLWVQQHHGDWSIQKLIELRVSLLESHHCTVTLANMKNSAGKSNE